MVTPKPSEDNVVYTTAAAGWPFLAFRTIERRAVGQATSGVSRGDELLPIWRGALADSLIYATGWFCITGLVRFLVNRIRRQRRIQRGLCPECAYNLREIKSDARVRCPECGALSLPRIKRNLDCQS